MKERYQCIEQLKIELQEIKICLYAPFQLAFSSHEHLRVAR
jgi:hypothetical protein